ncbi:MAG: hypothetical protein HY661_23290 [Betaproteobacteria bacterium]|nr:hypothetical protein [Betaproteobacteria bacterium]
MTKTRKRKTELEPGFSELFPRPKFLDWEPLTEEERRRENRARADARMKQEEELRQLMVNRAKKGQPKKRTHIVISRKG